MPSKYVLQQRGASGLENKAEIPALENGKIDMSWLPVVGESGAAIIARGSNANGEWVRWEDGTQVCWKILEGQANIAEATGSLYCSPLIQIGVWPAQFLTVPAVAVSAAYSYGAVLCRISGFSTASSCSGAHIIGTSKVSNEYNYRITTIAIGRWK